MERAAVQVGVLDGVGVAVRAFDAESEEVADAAYVAAGGVDLLEDAVLAQGLGSEVGVLPGEGLADGTSRGARAPVDEQVRVDGVRPGSLPVVEPGGEAGPDRGGERDVPVVEGEAAVDDVGQLQLAELLAGQGVEGDQGDGERDSRGRASSARGGSRRCPAAAERWRSPGGRHAAGGVGEDELRPLRTLNSDCRPYSAKLRREPLVGQRRTDLVRGDLGERLVAGSAQACDDGAMPEDVDAGGLRVAGASPRGAWGCRRA